MVKFYTKVRLEKEVELLREKKAKLEKELELLREKIARVVKELLAQEKELELAQEIYADREYAEIVVKTGLLDRIKKIILDHGPFTDSEIDVFVKENLNRPVLEDIFNDFKGNEDIRNAMKKYGVTDINPIMPHLIYLEFFGANENAN